MKNILVLTDFSKNARSAEAYALQLAIRVKANLILYNAYPVYAAAVSETVVWPHDISHSLELESISNLQARVDELNDELAKTREHVYKPTITHLGDAGSLARQIDGVAAKNNIWLIVMGTRGEGLANNMILGSNVFKVLDKINCPVLIIPQGAEFKEPGKIAYATDLRSTEVDIIELLKDLSGHLQTELFIVHVSTDNISPLDAFIKKRREQILLITNQIHIQSFHGKNIKDSLHEITEQMNADILALMHRKYGFFDALFHQSTSHKMIRHTEKPILIFPG